MKYRRREKYRAASLSIESHGNYDRIALRVRQNVFENFSRFYRRMLPAATCIFLAFLVCSLWWSSEISKRISRLSKQGSLGIGWRTRYSQAKYLQFQCDIAVDLSTSESHIFPINPMILDFCKTFGWHSGRSYAAAGDTDIAGFVDVALGCVLQGLTHDIRPGADVASRQMALFLIRACTLYTNGANTSLVSPYLSL